MIPVYCNKMREIKLNPYETSARRAFIPWGKVVKMSWRWLGEEMVTGILQNSWCSP